MKRRASRALDGARDSLSKATRRLSTTIPKADLGDYETLVDNANDLPAQDFQKRFVDSGRLHQSFSRDSNGHDIDIAFKSANLLTDNELTSCFDLIGATSRNDYEASSVGWHPRRKKREMRQDDMRYLLLTCRSTECSKSADRLPGFLSFMVTLDSIPAVPVLYIYEIHLDPAHRRLGLGEHLMRTAEEIARSVGAQKVMLTCFRRNTNAFAFYKRLGYAADACSPPERKIRSKLVKADYVILSKQLQSQDSPLSVSH